MANSRIYFYPGGTEYGGLRTIDFGERVSDLQITPYRDVSDSVSMGGAFSRVARRSGMRVRIVLERFTDHELAEKFYSLQSHIEAGGGFSFAVDSAKTFAAFVNATGSTSIGPGFAAETFTHDDRILSEYGAHGLAADDVIHMESFGPGARREELRVHSYDEAIKQIVSKTPAIYGHHLPALIRHRDFFPYLIWPESQTQNPIITHDHRISFTLDMTCEIYPGNTHSAYQKAGPDGTNIPDTDKAKQDGTTLDGVFSNSAATDVVTYDLSIGTMSPLDKAIKAAGLTEK